MVRFAIFVESMLHLERESYWVGLDDRSETGTYYSSTGVAVGLTDDVWETDGNGGGMTTFCASVPSLNGGFLAPASCTKLKPYVCQSSLLSSVPDNPCPTGYFPYKDICLKLADREGNYTTAQVI